MLRSLWAWNRLKISTPLGLKKWHFQPPPLGKMHKPALGLVSAKSVFLHTAAILWPIWFFFMKHQDNIFYPFLGEKFALSGKMGIAGAKGPCWLTSDICVCTPQGKLVVGNNLTESAMFVDIETATAIYSTPVSVCGQ